MFSAQVHLRQHANFIFPEHLFLSEFDSADPPVRLPSVFCMDATSPLAAELLKVSLSFEINAQQQS